VSLTVRGYDLTGGGKEHQQEPLQSKNATTEGKGTQVGKEEKENLGAGGIIRIETDCKTNSDSGTHNGDDETGKCKGGGSARKEKESWGML